MKQILVDSVARYKTMQINLKEKYPVFFSKSKNMLFFKNWELMHLELMNYFELENQEKIQEINSIFMAKRSRMASAFVQGIKIENKLDSELKIFKKILFDHDVIFKNILSEILKYYSKELIQAHRFRKVSAAYIHSFGG